MTRGTLFRLVALGAIVLMVGAAVCAFDDDASGDDLCMISLATVALVAVVCFLAVLGDPVSRPPGFYCLLPADLPSPPPKA